jgi:hypothetical protein
LLTGNSILTVRPTDETSFPIPPEVGQHSTLTALGAKLTRDTSPTAFIRLAAPTSISRQTFSPKRSAASTHSSPTKLRIPNIGARARSKCSPTTHFSAVPAGRRCFYGNCVYGTDNQLRGYVAGEYFTQYIVSTQVEYRLELPKRFGLVVFGGLGEIVPGNEQVLGT